MVDVVVVGDDVDFVGPRPVVDEVRELHEVRRDRLGRTGGADRVALLGVDLEQLVGAVPPEVERMRRVHEIRHAARRQHFAEVAIALRPHRGSPRVVQRVDRAVARAQPLLELAGRLVAEVDLPVLVSDMPHPDGGMPGVALGQLGGDRQGMLAVDVRGRGELVARSGDQTDAIAVDGQGLGVQQTEPRRGRRSRGREVDGDAAPVQDAEHVVEPREIALARERARGVPS